MTPVAILTGFLGSGKTTLVRRLLADPGMADTAVIVNEFGEIGLDHHLIEAGDESVLRLATGCLCCAVRSDLVATLLDLAARRARGEIAYRRVLVETSGLADPAPILHALMTDAKLAEGHALAGMTALVDSVLGEATLGRHAEARRQIAFADRVVVSKTDLAPASAGLLAMIRGLNPGAAMVLDLFGGSGGGVPDSVPVHTKGIGTCLVRRVEPVPALAVTLLLQTLAEVCGERLLRVKGLFDLVEAPGRPAVVHAVGHVISPVEFLDRWPDGDRTSRAVVIGVDLPPYLPARLLEAIEEEVKEEMFFFEKKNQKTSVP